MSATRYVYGIATYNGPIRYIGQTGSLKDRFSEIETNKTNNYLMTPWVARNKGNLKMIVIRTCGRKQVDDLERKEIFRRRSEGHALFNIAPGGREWKMSHDATHTFMCQMLDHWTTECVHGPVPPEDEDIELLRNFVAMPLSERIAEYGRVQKEKDSIQAHMRKRPVGSKPKKKKKKSLNAKQRRRDEKIKSDPRNVEAAPYFEIGEVNPKTSQYMHIHQTLTKLQEQVCPEFAFKIRQFLASL